jgi:predicted dehydrogenase
LVEKPMAVHVEEAVEMVHTCRAHGVKLGVGFHLRHHPGHQEARRLIGAGVLGTITLVQAQWGAGARGQALIPLEVFRDARSGQRSAWWVEPEGVGGTWTMMAMGTHCIDLLHFLLGQDIVEVAAPTDGQRRNSPLERMATMCVRFTGGSLGMVCCGSRMPDSKNDATLYGRMVLGGFPAHRAARLPGGRQRHDQYHGVLPTGYAGLVYTTGRSVQQCHPARYGAHGLGLDGLRVVQATVAMVKSASTGRAVKTVPLAVE